MRVKIQASITIMMLLILLGGCDQRKEVERKDLSFQGVNQNEVLDHHTYPFLSAFMGAMTTKDLLTVLDTSMTILNTCQTMGYTSKTDYEVLLRIMTNLRNTMAREMGGNTINTTLVADLSAMLAIMAGGDPAYPHCGVGPTLDQLVRRVGPDVLSNEVTVMLSYVMAADTQTLKDAVAGLTLNDIKTHPAQFRALMTMVNGMLDPDPTGRYSPFYQGLIDYSGNNGLIDQLGAVPGSEIKLGDLKPVLAALKAVDFSSSGFFTAATESALDNALNALELIIDGRASRLRQADIEGLCYLLYKFVAWWNGPQGSVTINPDVIRDTVTEVIDLLATDPAARQALAGLLYSVVSLLNSADMPVILNQLGTAMNETGLPPDKTLRTLLNEMLMQLPSVPAAPVTTDNGRSLAQDLFGSSAVGDLGLLTRIAQDYSLYGGVDEGLAEYFIARDQLGVLRTASGRESAFVSLLKVIKNSDTSAPITAVALAGFIPVVADMYALDIVYPQYLQGASWTNCQRDPTRDISEFIVDEMVRAIKYRYGVSGASPYLGGAPQAADYNGNGVVDPNEAMYWLFWAKRYHIAYNMVFTFEKDYYGVLNFAFMRLQDLTILIYGPPDNPYAMDLAPPLVRYTGLVNDCSSVYPGRIRDLLPALAALSGWGYNVTYGNGHVTTITPAQNPATSQPRHTMIALMWPLMDYFAGRGETDRLVDLLGGILDRSTVHTISGIDVTDSNTIGSYTTATALQRLEGIHGTGVIPRALGKHAANDHGLLDNALPLIACIIKRLDDSGVLRTRPQNLTAELNAVLRDWVKAGQTPVRDPDLLLVEKLDNKLFVVQPGETTTLFEQTRRLLAGNQAQLAALCTALGDLMTKGNDLDPLLGYATGSPFFTNLRMIWDGGNTWNKLKADIDDIKLQLQIMTGTPASNLMQELETALYDLCDLDNPPADIATKPVTALMRHLLIEDTSFPYNPFVDGLTSLLCKTLDLYDADYNPGAVLSPTGISANTTVVDAVKFVSEAYDLRPVQNLLTALTEKQTAAGDLLLYKFFSDLATFSNEALSNETVPLSIIQSMFREVDTPDGRTSTAGLVIDQVLPGMILVDDGALSFQSVLADTYKLFNGIDMQPSGDVYKTFHDVLDFVVENTTVR